MVPTTQKALPTDVDMIYIKIAVISVFLAVWNVWGQDVSESTTQASDYIYVVALEKESDQATSETWDPTLYKIDIKKGNVVQTVKLAEQGAPAFCQRLGDKDIRVYIDEGIAANGSVVGNPIQHEYVVDKATLSIRKETTNPERIEELSVSYVEGLDRSQWRNFTQKKGVVFLGQSPITKQIYLFSNYISDIDLKNLELKILNEHSSQEPKSVPLGVGDRDLRELEHTIFLRERFFICLFKGRGYLGCYGAGYVMIIDLNSKQVNYVTIGSNPALGIAY